MPRGAHPTPPGGRRLARGCVSVQCRSTVGMTTSRKRRSSAREKEIRIRLSPDEAHRLGTAAKAAHLPLGTWLRRLGLDASADDSGTQRRVEREVLAVLRRALAH